ncbi:MAG: LysR family transcriptional regulator [Colwellia sp.]|nr:LysR family transcriptional regulator [Colwellia sp.]
MNHNPLNRLKLIAIFCRVIDSGSMRKAAKTLGITAPAVSQFIGQLEAELAITLIYRTTRKISLSEAGKQYYREGKLILIAAENADNVINELKQSLQGELRISLPVGLATTPIAEALTPLLRDKPELNLSIIASDEYIDPVEERIDISMRVGKPEDSGLIYHHFANPVKHIFASPSYLKTHGIPVIPADLDKHTWLGLRHNSSLNEMYFTQPEKIKTAYTPKLRMKFNDLNSMIAHVKQGFGLAVLPKLEIKHLLKSGELVSVLDDWSMEGYHLYALTMDKNLSMKVKVALDMLKEYFAKHQNY